MTTATFSEAVVETAIAPISDPVSTATVERSPLLTSGVFVTIHGHFYQPPRENPDLNAIERQPSAAPFHDWNARICHECYRTNAFARVLNDRGEVIQIVNNFEYLSFNIGPTLMSWLEGYDPEVYERIIEADRHSCERLNGHGNAIAQVYNHIILPLANPRDRLTQIRWGKADFRARFGRDPEGMWLAEAAVDYPTLEALASEGIQFIILAPSQAQRCRPIPADAADSHPWQEVGGGQIDPTRPYRCFLPGGARQDFIDIFFYDGPISRDMGFNDVLSSSNHFAGRLAQAVRGDRQTAQLISVATDGETFGHHKRNTERALAYALVAEFPQRGWSVTNFAHYLSLEAPTWEVELKPVTAWSCAHGVDRWQDDCGCGGEGSLWHQKWRRPLRDALDWLRDRLAQVYQDAGEPLLVDPWQARDAYIEVFGASSNSAEQADRAAKIAAFLEQHQQHPLSPAEQVDALRLLEMQRHTLLMYTSCGWFFEELSRPEGVQLLRYAGRAIALASEVTGVNLEGAFIQRLALAPSNVETFQNGAEVYRQLVLPSQVNFEQVAAHYAITSLFTTYPQSAQVYCFQAQQLDYQLQRMGTLTLAFGQLHLTSEITQETAHLMFGVLHLGGWDFYCGVQPFGGRRTYTEMKAQVLEALQQASTVQVILALSEAFGANSYSLHHLFAEERHRIITLLSQDTLSRLDQLYTQVYRNNYSLLMAYRRDNLEVPEELKMAAQVALRYQAIKLLQSLEQALNSPEALTTQAETGYLNELTAVATEAQQLGCPLSLGDGEQILEGLILQSLTQLLVQGKTEHLKLRLQRLTQLIELVHTLHLEVQLDRAQELYYQAFQTHLLPVIWQQIPPENQPQGSEAPEPPDADNPFLPLSNGELRQLLRLGVTLAVDVHGWFKQME
ncbi:DUF3536 domain-containing protein [Synechococcales cyanobacterium C]|uniref:DUF3536 domain-containing protein n=1 Tax=Petrachloros mirabilis ULC683 TaxID=2781853 RepID=A0A8K2A7C9_9CYAN|nr:DUF3536 domain-containing protein [Petrachloros mirabilis]NCJ06771.1 DUF3536 domain-containing protein [Petrachloros mirabilis ULC683]